MLDAVSWTFFAIALIFCSLRLYSDVCVLHYARLDTYLSSAVFALIVASQISTTLSVRHGLGQHIGSLEPVQLVSTLRWSWIAQILQLIANTGAKLAAMAYLTTIQGPTHPKAKAGFLGTLCILQVASIVTLLAIILAQCSPIEKLWDEALPGTCNGIIRNRQFGFFQGESGSKYSLRMWNCNNTIFRAAICSIVKTVNVHRIGENNDVTYDLSYLITWNAVDMYVVFIAGSVPTLRPFFKKHFHQPTLPKYLHYGKHRTPVQGDDGIALVTLPFPPGRAAVSASVTGKKSPSPLDTGDAGLGPNGELGNGEILKTTRIETSRASAT
ncbi:hypothetical protein XANCAGTX0491_009267 [Xanthoria calcicola]